MIFAQNSTSSQISPRPALMCASSVALVGSFGFHPIFSNATLSAGFLNVNHLAGFVGSDDWSCLSPARPTGKIKSQYQFVSDHVGERLNDNSILSSRLSASIHLNPSGLIHTGLYIRGIHTASFSGTFSPLSTHFFLHASSIRR